MVTPFRNSNWLKTLMGSILFIIFFDGLIQLCRSWRWRAEKQQNPSISIKKLKVQAATEVKTAQISTWTYQEHQQLTALYLHIQTDPFSHHWGLHPLLISSKTPQDQSSNAPKSSTQFKMRASATCSWPWMINLAYGPGLNTRISTRWSGLVWFFPESFISSVNLWFSRYLPIKKVLGERRSRFADQFSSNWCLGLVYRKYIYIYVQSSNKFQLELKEMEGIKMSFLN